MLTLGNIQENMENGFKPSCLFSFPFVAFFCLHVYLQALPPSLTGDLQEEAQQEPARDALVRLPAAGRGLHFMTLWVLMNTSFCLSLPLSWSSTSYAESSFPLPVSAPSGRHGRHFFMTPSDTLSPFIPRTPQVAKTLELFVPFNCLLKSLFYSKFPVSANFWSVMSTWKTLTSLWAIPFRLPPDWLAGTQFAVIPGPCNKDTW